MGIWDELWAVQAHHSATDASYPYVEFEAKSEKNKSSENVWALARHSLNWPTSWGRDMANGYLFGSRLQLYFGDTPYWNALVKNENSTRAQAAIVGRQAPDTTRPILGSNNDVSCQDLALMTGDDTKRWLGV